MEKRNLPLIIGVSLPIFFILAASLAIFIPSFFIKPQHNFIYSTNSSDYYGYYYGYRNGFGVENNRIVLVPAPARENDANMAEMPPLYVYNVKESTSRLISFDEATAFSLEPGPSSPDGYTVAYQYGGHDGIFELFGSSGNRSGMYVSKGNSKKKLGGMGSERNFRLIGWIK